MSPSISQKQEEERDALPRQYPNNIAGQRDVSGRSPFVAFESQQQGKPPSTQPTTTTTTHSNNATALSTVPSPSGAVPSCTSAAAASPTPPRELSGGIPLAAPPIGFSRADFGVGSLHMANKLEVVLDAIVDEFEDVDVRRTPVVAVAAEFAGVAVKERDADVQDVQCEVVTAPSLGSSSSPHLPSVSSNASEVPISIPTRATNTNSREDLLKKDVRVLMKMMLNDNSEASSSSTPSGLKGKSPQRASTGYRSAKRIAGGAFRVAGEVVVWVSNGVVVVNRVFETIPEAVERIMAQRGAAATFFSFNGREEEENSTSSEPASPCQQPSTERSRERPQTPQTHTPPRKNQNTFSPSNKRSSPRRRPTPSAPTSPLRGPTSFYFEEDEYIPPPPQTFFYRSVDSGFASMSKSGSVEGLPGTGH
ncbi:hypothetical protein HDV05_005478 [Chytridiales sp. JEL 0842]|nr:hypothetical protein HDV05_005478 [Chytridiales sp. JEL 0842]